MASIVYCNPIKIHIDRVLKSIDKEANCQTYRWKIEDMEMTGRRNDGGGQPENLPDKWKRHTDTKSPGRQAVDRQKDLFAVDRQAAKELQAPGEKVLIVDRKAADRKVRNSDGQKNIKTYDGLGTATDRQII